MTSTIYAELGRDRQRQLFADAEEYRLARQARTGSAGRHRRRWSRR
jgi:hypothetical protein